MKDKLRKTLKNYLFVIFVGFTLVLYSKEGLSSEVWAFSAPRNEIEDFIFLGNKLLWTFLLLSLIVYFIFAAFEKQTHLVISGIHVFVIVLYLLFSDLEAYRLECSIINVCLLFSNIVYVIYEYLKSKELLEEDILDA